MIQANSAEIRELVYRHTFGHLLIGHQLCFQIPCVPFIGNIFRPNVQRIIYFIPISSISKSFLQLVVKHTSSHLS